MKPFRIARVTVPLVAGLVPLVSGGNLEAQGYASDPPRTFRLSLADSGAQGNGDSQSLISFVSSSGTWAAFHSDANLASIDTNAHLDVYVREHLSSSTHPVSVSMTGTTMGNGPSRYASISDDGRYVCFLSAASDLVSGDTNLLEDVFVRDLWSGSTRRVSVASDGTQADNGAAVPCISATGRFVAFESYSTNLDTSVPSNGQLQIYLHDRDGDGNAIFDQSGAIQTRMMSTNSTRTTAGVRCENPTVSADGRFVAFEAQSSLHANDQNSPFLDCYVHDRDADGNGIFDEPGAISIQPVSVGPSGSCGDGDSHRPVLASGGQWVIFGSSASDLLSQPDTNADTDLFVYGPLGSSAAAVVARLSEAPGHLQVPNPNVQYKDISADGRFVAFDTLAPLLSGDTNAQRDVYLCDRDRDEDGMYDELGPVSLSLTSINRRRVVGNGPSWLPGVSDDGALVAFSSFATNLVSGDSNAAEDVFLREVTPLRRKLDPSVGTAVPVVLQNGTATFSQNQSAAFSPDQVFDGNSTGDLNGWAIVRPGAVALDEVAVWESAADIARGTLRVRTYSAHTSNTQHLMGRFRFSVTADDRATYADGLDNGGAVVANWTVLSPTSILLPAGMTYTVLPDQSVLTGGAVPDTGTYELEFQQSLNGVTGIRLEVLEHSLLPQMGPGHHSGNGNFHLTELVVESLPLVP